MTLDEMKRNDPGDMYGLIDGFSRQVHEAIQIGTAATVKLPVKQVQAIVLTGLGGSAIGGDLLRSYLSAELKVPFVVNRHYRLPGFVGPKSLVIVSSYSGNTEETIAAYRDAIKRRARILCITTGGEVASIAGRHRHPVVALPSGLSPRAALGYSLFPLLVVLSRLGIIRSRKKDLEETVALLAEKARRYRNPVEGNLAWSLARKLQGKIPVIYTPVEHFDSVGLRWRGQIAENAKQLSFGHVVPEMNHNELVGWKARKELLKTMEVIFLRDKGTHPRVAKREEITKSILGEYASGVTEVWSEGDSLLARMFSLVHLGDWLSYYLAMLNREDPTPVQAIDSLKAELAKIS
jgi:glucose/mannose-6-phosphate isomerase